MKNNTLKYETKKTEVATEIVFNGAITERSDEVFEEIAKIEDKEIIFNFEGIEYINSLGIRQWISFLKDFESNHSITFEKCTVDIVMQINLHSRFVGNSKINSFLCDFSCPSCEHELSKLFFPKDGYDKLLTTLAEQDCPSCQTTLIPDVPEETYLSFLRT